MPRSCIYELWDAFNDIAEGFGLTIDEFHEIIKAALIEHLDITEKMLHGDCDAVFRIFDSDEASYSVTAMSKSIFLRINLRIV